MNTRNYATKSMYPLFESVCVRQGAVQHGPYHEARFIASYRQLFGASPGYGLWNGISLEGAEAALCYKLRIAYGRDGTQWQLLEYRSALPRTLRLVCDDTLEYGLKYSDRSGLARLAGQKDGADDVLIVRHGLVTDSTYCNIVFRRGGQAFTPRTPLLQGTCRARLIRENGLVPADIRPGRLSEYEGFQLVNAMNDFDPKGWQPMEALLP